MKNGAFGPLLWFTLACLGIGIVFLGAILGNDGIMVAGGAIAILGIGDMGRAMIEHQWVPVAAPKTETDRVILRRFFSSPRVWTVFAAAGVLIVLLGALDWSRLSVPWAVEWVGAMFAVYSISWARKTARGWRW